MHEIFPMIFKEKAMDDGTVAYVATEKQRTNSRFFFILSIQQNIGFLIVTR